MNIKYMGLFWVTKCNAGAIDYYIICICDTGVAFALVDKLRICLVDPMLDVESTVNLPCIRLESQVIWP